MMNITIRFITFIVLLFSIGALHSQTKEKRLIQFSGVVVSSDSLGPIPYTSLIIKNKNRGTVSDFFGYFSFVAQVSDTIEFSAIGFKTSYYIIPDSLTNSQYSIIEVLNRDTFFLDQVEVYPWPSPEQFKQAFLKLNITDDDIIRAQRNLAREEVRNRVQGVAMDGGLNYKYAMQKQHTKLYYAGQYPTTNLLNPIAWSKFIRAWQRGDFKRE